MRKQSGEANGLDVWRVRERRYGEDSRSSGAIYERRGCMLRYLGRDESGAPRAKLLGPAFGEWYELDGEEIPPAVLGDWEPPYDRVIYEILPRAAALASYDSNLVATQGGPDAGAGDQAAGAFKYDKNKLRWNLLPLDAVERVVEVLSYGAAKYRPGGWMRVPDARERYFAALMRHLVAWRGGQKTDPESGLHHLSHALCDCLFLAWFETCQKERTDGV